MTFSNAQPIHKQQLQAGGKLFVHSIFNTIQGEGPFSGMPATFIRLYGCNLRCPKCDTDYTGRQVPMLPRDVLRMLSAAGQKPYSDLIVITGGEPFRQNIGPLVTALLDAGYVVQIETNGTLYLDGFPYDHENLFIVCSPKTGSINPNLAPHILAYKYVLAHKQVSEADGLPILALKHPARPHVARPHDGFEGIVYIQPVDERDAQRNELNLRATVESCKKYGYTLNLQLHKLIGVE